MSSRGPSWAFAAIALLVGCNVPAPLGSTGGATDGAAAACLRGISVVETDYFSTNVALLALDGTVLSERFASSRTAAVGLTAPLSGDVVFPTLPSSGRAIILLDRSESRINWVDLRLKNAVVTLPVATGFNSSPQDYLGISKRKAYVPRLLQNTAPEKVPFDSGSDVLIVDPSVPSITGAIDLRPALGTDYPDVLPRPGPIVSASERAYVLLESYGDTNLTTTRPSRVTAIDLQTDSVVDTLVLDGFLDCVGLAPSPDGQQLAVLCAGNPSMVAHPLKGSGIVIVGVNGGLHVNRSFRAADLGTTPIGFFGDFATTEVLLFSTFGSRDSKTQAILEKDTLVRLDISTGDSEVVQEGAPFTLEGIACDAICGVCFAADAGTDGGVVHRYEVTANGHLVNARAIKVERSVGLPPRYLGKF